MPFFTSANDLVNDAEKLAKILADDKDIKTHQLRRLYERIQCLKERAENISDDGASPEFSSLVADCKLLKPQLAYAVSRNRSLQPLYDKVKGMVDGIDNKARVKEFYDFFQSIMCYHKFHLRDKEGGKQ